ncbi:hypothetical protein E2C01_012887 [Portunus trituberculatus]|uniref:Uncharacterized protein n=1 Tax=Portunus trituberculatus TaxID=210409 RepID=A0A5B7DFH0_PORTR|nr:hypothetical protein [Portunus trituberculatus]
MERLRIGHTYLTQRYLLTRDPQPYCDDCLVPLTVRHLLVECPSLMDLRHRYLYRCRVLVSFVENLPIDKERGGRFECLIVPGTELSPALFPSNTMASPTQFIWQVCLHHTFLSLIPLLRGLLKGPHPFLRAPL